MTVGGRVAVALLGPGIPIPERPAIDRLAPRVAPIFHLGCRKLPAVYRRFFRRPLHELDGGQGFHDALKVRAAAWLVSNRTPGDERLMERLDEAWSAMRERGPFYGDAACPGGLVLIEEHRCASSELFNLGARLGTQVVLLGDIANLLGLMAKRFDERVRKLGPQWALADGASTPITRDELEVAGPVILGDLPPQVMAAFLGIPARVAEAHARRVLDKHSMRWSDRALLAARCRATWE